MASKTTIVSPEGARTARCSATCDSYHSGVIPPSYQGGATRAYTNYQVIATGVGNWRPKLIKVTHSYTYSDGSTDGKTIIYQSSDYGDANPWSFPATKNYSATENPFEETETDPGTEWRLRTIDDTITGVEVVFEEGTPTTTYTASASANPSGWGTVKVGSAAAGSTSTLTNITAGSTVTVVATPETGYRFVSWSDGGAQTHDVTVNSDINLTATFEQVPVASVTITLVAHNGWGQVRFENETPTTGTVLKIVPAGTSVKIEAIQTGYPGYVFWRTPSGDSYGNRVRTITPTTDVTYTAFFGYICHGHVAELSDPETILPVGNVQIVYNGGSTGWVPHMTLYVFDGPGITFNQQASLVGWSFVKWRYRRQGTSDWSEYTGQSISNYPISNGGLYAIALFQRTPTHLLVNSYSRSKPTVQLVYDPATNKLVADY